MTEDPAELRRERRILFWMCVVIAVNQLGFGAVIPVMPLYAQSFGVSQSAIGATVAVYGLGRFLVAMPVGHLADALGRRPTLALGGLVSGLGNLWCAVAGSYAELVAARLVAGLGAGIVITCGAVILADISTPARRGRTMALYQGTFLFAVGIGPFPGGLLAEHFGLAAPFAAYAVAGLGVGLLAWFAVAETRGLREAAGGHGGGARPGLAGRVRALLALDGFRLVSAILFMNAVARTGALFSIVPVLAEARLGLGASRIGFGLFLGSLVGILVTYPAGALADRYGRKPVIVPATVGAGLSMVLFCVAPDYAWFLAACLVWGSAISVGGAAPAAYAADSAPPGMNATAMSTFRMIGDFGYVVGPLVLGAMADRAGAQSALWVAAAGLVFAGLAFARWAPETYPGPGRG
jgi:MFS family permease